MATKKGWYRASPKKALTGVPAHIKSTIQQRADELVEAVIKPAHLKPPPTDNDFNYLADIFTKWHRNYFYFCSTYNCPGPQAIRPSFESKFARLEYAGSDNFNLAYFRHTGQWFELYQELTIDEALKCIAEDPYFIP